MLKFNFTVSGKTLTLVVNGRNDYTVFEKDNVLGKAVNVGGIVRTIKDRFPTTTLNSSDLVTEITSATAEPVLHSVKGLAYSKITKEWAGKIKGSLVTSASKDAVVQALLRA